MFIARIAATLGLGLIALPATGQDFDGSYDGNGCVTEVRSDLAVYIAWPTISFHESQCTVTGGDLVPGMAETYSYSAVCQGEGEEWTRSYVIAPNFDGGIVIVQDGFGQSYSRCDG